MEEKTDETFASLIIFVKGFGAMKISGHVIFRVAYLLLAARGLVLRAV